ncbi:hypothetical protein ACIBCN_43145 [Nocardia sp. NPDC051052]
MGFASHWIGSATATGVIRDVQSSYNLAWYLAGGLCDTAAFIRRNV